MFRTDYDYLIIKYGDQPWAACYDGSANSDDEATALAIDGSGNVYVTGYSGFYPSGIATVEYNSDGVQEWVARYDGPGNCDDEAVALAIDGSGNVYVTGYSRGEGWAIYSTIKYVQPPAIDCGVRGDVNGDTSINVLDVVMAVQAILQAIEPDECMLWRTPPRSSATPSPAESREERAEGLA